MNKVCVLGSINMDLVLKVKNMPLEGETIFAKSFDMIPGGKGANQAIAAKRSGAEVFMIAKIGQDDNGKILKDTLNKDLIDTKFVFVDEKEPTGMAIIMVNEGGNNSILVVKGANMTIEENEIDEAIEVIEKSDIVISQFETSDKIIKNTFKRAKELNKLTILNPAPAKKIDDDLLKYTDILVPNETEAESLTKVKVVDLETAKDAAKFFINKGVKVLIITLGAKGVAVIAKEYSFFLDAFKVNAIDTTAAGDSFIGGLSSKLEVDNLSKENLLEAVKFGNKVASIAVQRKGAAPSIPYLKEVLEVYNEK